MSEEFLNQDEIDALLSGDTASDGVLSRAEAEAMQEVATIFAGAAGNVVGMLAGRTVTAEVVLRSELEQSKAKNEFSVEKIFSFSMTLDGIDSPVALLLTTEQGALALADLMMGGDAQELPEEANDLYLSASQEGISQLVGSALTNLSSLVGGGRVSAGNTSAILTDVDGWLPFQDRSGDECVWQGKIQLNVEGLDPFFLYLILTAQDAQHLAQKIIASMEPEEPAPAPVAKAASTQPVGPVAPQPQPISAVPPIAQQAPAYTLPPRAPQAPVDVQPAEFAPFGVGEFVGGAASGNIDLIVDIPVRVTVELGRTRKKIGEVLALGPGSIVELNKMAGEPVDVLVNGKLVARGEVVVIDESFGVRVTEVVSRAERIRSMGV